MENNDNKKGLPNKQQLAIMMQRYSSVQLVPIDTNRDTITIQSDTASFKKPIFFDTDCGKVTQKILMGLKEQAFYPPNAGRDSSRIVLEGNMGLVQKTMAIHAKSLGDDPYNPKKPYDNKIELYEGLSTATEESLYEQINDEIEQQEFNQQSS